MSHKCGRTSSSNVKVFSTKSIVSRNSCPSPNRFTADSKHIKHRSETHGLHKTKHLKTRKERSQIRATSKVTSSKVKSHRQHYHGHCSKDARFHNYRHCSSVRNAQFPSVVPAAQERSIITDSRLIGHHGLFNHKVKSVDIERLLSEQKKLELAGQHVKEKKSATPHLHPADMKASAGLLTDDADVLKTAANNDGHQKRKKNIPSSDEGSHITPEQRPQRQLDLSSESVKSLKHSSVSPVTTMTKKSNDVTSELSKRSNFTPIVDRPNVKTFSKKAKKHIICSLEQTLDSPEVPTSLTQPRAISPSPLQLSTSITAGNVDKQHRQDDLKHVSKSVAARLCGGLQFPFQRMKNLASESREVLLKCLHDKHGPWLQENLLELQACPKFDKVSTKAVQHVDHGFTGTEDNRIPPTDAFLKRTKRRHSNWKSNVPLYQTPQQTAAWLPFPDETSVSGLEDSVRPTDSSQFCLDFQPSKSLASHSFATSPLLCHDEKASDSQHWHDALFKSKDKDSHVFDSFQSSFMKHTKGVREQRYGSHYCDGKMQPPFTHQDRHTDVYSMEEIHFPQHQDPFTTNTQPFAPSISAQNNSILQNSHFSTFNPFSDHPHLTGSCHSDKYADMIHFPSSRILERGSQTPRSSFPSPEHWSFPAMRLY